MAGEPKPVPSRLRWIKSGKKVDAVQAVAQHAFDKIVAASRLGKAARLTAEDTRALDWCVRRLYEAHGSENWRAEPFTKDPSHG